VRHQEPLTPKEQERFWRRERQLTLVHAVALGVLLLAVVAGYRYIDTAWFRSLFLWVVGAFVVASAVVQVMERCPRCGVRLRRRLLALPDRCAACGVPLTRPPAAG
jgi:hypothetical protein